MRNIYMFFWLVLAFFCVVYGVMIRMAGSGTLFFLVWIALGVLCCSLALVVKTGLWSRMPGPAKVVVSVCVIACAVFFLIQECFILSGFHKKGKADLDYLIVLGAQVYPDRPSPILSYRLNTAAEYLEMYPDTQCIVSGGQGYNEICPEAEIMADYLMKKGIPEERIIQEDKALTTLENIRNSMEFMKEDSSVGIVTNDFHVYRSLCIAKDAGLSDVCGIAAPSKPEYLPNNMLREFFALIKYYISR